jgi:hypothetical protein
MATRLTEEKFPLLFNLIKNLKELDNEARFLPAGSFEVTLDGPYNDVDVVIYSKDLVPILILNGWEASNPYPEGTSLKKKLDNETVNFIVVDNMATFLKWVRATNLCKHLSLKDKNQRILIHEMFFHGNLQKCVEEI